MVRRLLAGFVLVAATVSTVTATTQITVYPSRRAPIDDLRVRIAAAIGAGATSCGEHDTGNVVKHNAVTPQILQRFLDCLADARGRGVAAWAFQGGSGFDSWVADGLMIAADGATTHFDYDSIACVRDDCTRAFTIEDCPLPRVSTDPSWPHFECVSPR